MSVAAAQSADAAPTPTDPCAISGSRGPLLVRWSPVERAAIAAAMREGIAVVAADDCRGVRLLPRCHPRGRYGYAGIAVKTHTVSLTNEEELRINAPVASAGDAGVVPMRVDVTAVGQGTTPRHLLTPAELVGECQGATHFVASAQFGAAVVTTGKAVANSSAVQACASGGLEEREPPKACDTVLSVTINPIAELGDLVDFVRGYQGAALNVGMCPAPLVVSGLRCTRPPVNAPFLCAFGDGPGCREQCDRGDINSCDVLAMMTWHGKGVAKDSAAAAALYAKACDRDDRIACANVGVMTYRGDGVAQDKAKGAAFFDRACRLGALDACANLATAYAFGAGVAVDKARASSLLTRGCDAGSADSCSRLATALLRGELGPPDVKRGVAILEELCEGNEALGCTELGRLHILGESVPSDHARAATLFSRSCRAGGDDACVMLGLLYRQADGVSRDDVLATRLMERACNNGNADGCHNLGIAYEHGKGVPASVTRAADLYEKACNAGSGTACMYLGDFAESGTAIAKDANRAQELRAKACSLGEKRACPR